MTIVCISSSHLTSISLTLNRDCPSFWLHHYNFLHFSLDAMTWPYATNLIFVVVLFHFNLVRLILFFDCCQLMICCCSCFVVFFFGLFFENIVLKARNIKLWCQVIGRWATVWISRSWCYYLIYFQLFL